MAFTNIPANLQDMFYALTDRIAKLETGPNQAMYEATTAYSVATESQLQAINASIQANNAASQATIAQAQATIASTQATAAQTSANGKNKNTYSTSAPGSTANIAGDLWFQYGTTSPYTNKVIAQFVGQGGTTWASMPISGLVVTNIDAGSITTGTLSAIQISAGSGSQAFNVSSTGALTATGAVINGNITATSGTFNGTVNAQGGYFGSASNGWSIGSTGLTGVGTATITGGAINGASITASSGSIGGFSLSSTYLNGTNVRLNSDTGNITSNAITASGTVSANAGLVLGGTLSAGGNTFNNVGTINVPTGNIVVTTGTISAGSTITASGDLYAQQAITATTTAATNCYITTSGQIRRTSTTSSEKYKENITDIANVDELNPKALLDLPIRAFTYKEGHIPDTDDRYMQMLPGFIAEELDEVYPIAVDYSDGVETWNPHYIIPALLALIQDQDKRIKALEAKQ